MGQITFNGNVIRTAGDFPAIGTIAKDFSLTRKDFTEATLASYGTKKKLLNIFPSIDTPTCADSVRTFYELVIDLDNVILLNISADLPFAQSRFCAGITGCNNCEALSSFRSTFGKDWGVTMLNSPMAGLLSRAVVVLSPDNYVVHAEHVSEIAVPPNFSRAIAALKADYEPLRADEKENDDKNDNKRDEVRVARAIR